MIPERRSCFRTGASSGSGLIGVLCIVASLVELIEDGVCCVELISKFLRLESAVISSG